MSNHTDIKTIMTIKEANSESLLSCKVEGKLYGVDLPKPLIVAV